MIKILGSFKAVPDFDQLSEEDWKADADNRIDVSFVKTIWNCFDESALEMMLRLSDNAESLGIPCQLDAVNVGEKSMENYHKTLYALGFERAVWIECKEEIQYWPELTAGLIAEYVSQKGGHDVVVMGRQTSDGDNGKTPLLTAERLGWPCITQVIGIEPVDDAHLKVISMTDEGICTQTMMIPCVLSVGDAPCGYLRVPTLKDRMQKGKRPIEHYTMNELQVESSFEDVQPGVQLVELETVQQVREGTVIEGESAAVTADLLYETYLKERL